MERGMEEGVVDVSFWGDVTIRKEEQMREKGRKEEEQMRERKGMGGAGTKKKVSSV